MGGGGGTSQEGWVAAPDRQSAGLVKQGWTGCDPHQDGFCREPFRSLGIEECFDCGEGCIEFLSLRLGDMPKFWT